MIKINVSLNEGEEIVKSKIFNASFNYNNMDNKFDLSQYQKSIELNLVNKISEEILVFLNIK